MGDQHGRSFSEIFFLLGVSSFARFHGLTIEEVDQILDQPNTVLFDMIYEMEQSLSQYEDFMVKIKSSPDRKEGLSRLEILDL
ncbi:MAG: hypothetical protein ACTSSP_07230 [Candidatus Asgardarchaeia archaeon]